MDSHLLLLTLIFGAVLTLCFYLRSFFRYVYLVSKVPGPSLWEFLTVYAGKCISVDTMMDAFISLSETWNFKPYGMWFKNAYFVVVVSDAESLREVFKSTCMKNKPGHVYDVITTYMGRGLISINGDEHKRHRRLLMSPFRKAALESHLPQINEEVSTVIEQIREQSKNDVINYESLSQSKAKIVGGLLLTGKSYRAEVERYFKAVKMVSEVIRTQMFNPFWMLIKLTKSMRTKLSLCREALDVLGQIFEKEKPLFIESMKDGREPSNIGECMALHYCEDALTEEEGLAEAFHTFGASAESLAFAESACLYLLALHPDVQERVYDEVESISGGSDRAAEPEDLSRMVYLDMVLKETFRLFPPTPHIGRRVDEETYFQGMLLPKDCTIMVDLLSLHRNPNHFKDPLKFDPERFSTERSLDLHPFAYLPFSYGKRDCPGQFFAMLALKCSLLRIIKNFKVYPTEGLKCVADIRYPINITFVVEHMPLRFVVRNNNTSSCVTVK